MSVLDDASLDERVTPIVDGDIERAAPTMELFQRAALLDDRPTPAMLEDAAVWLGIVDDLAAAGLTREQILRVALRTNKATFGRHGPSIGVLGHLFAIPEGRAVAVAVCEDLLATGKPPSHAQQHLANVALARLAADSAIEPRFEGLFGWARIEPAQLRAIIASLPEQPANRREAFVLTRIPETPASASQAAFLLDRLLWIADLVPAVRARFSALLAAAEGEDEHTTLAAEIAGEVPRTLEARPTSAARYALGYWEDLLAKTAEGRTLGPLAEALWSERRIAVDAPELATVAAWQAATQKRQKQIAADVAAALTKHVGRRCTVVDLASFGGPPIAILACGAQQFCLVPGGTVEMGMSEEEEAAIRAHAEDNAGRANEYEMYGSLIDNLDRLRPVVSVTVAPLLVARGPGELFEIDDAVAALDDSRLRLLSEAEWEYLARGGVQRELTYFDDVVPDDPSHYLYIAQGGAKLANAFGVWGFGIEPELCADAWAESHDGAALDGSPRRGPGPRVSRGGAGQVFMWQDTGEWQLLLSAMRNDASMWKYQVALRFALGIDCGGR